MILNLRSINTNHIIIGAFFSSFALSLSLSLGLFVSRIICMCTPTIFASSIHDTNNVDPCVIGIKINNYHLLLAFVGLMYLPLRKAIVHDATIDKNGQIWLKHCSVSSRHTREEKFAQTMQIELETITMKIPMPATFFHS